VEPSQPDAPVASAEPSPPPPEPEAAAEDETTEAEAAGEKTEPDSEAEVIDLALVPESRERPLSPEIPRLAEAPARPPERTADLAVPPPRMEEFTAPETLPATPSARPAGNPAEPQIKSIGGAAGSSGGSPPRRNADSRVNLLSHGDAIMDMLAHKYGEYMRKMARQLQDSLNRQMILAPFNYTRGQVKIQFGVSPDGGLVYQQTVFPLDGSRELERVLSERTVREAAPFDPFTPQMLNDAKYLEFFQKLTVVVNLY
jgi:hypothetical protein